MLRGGVIVLIHIFASNICLSIPKTTIMNSENAFAGTILASSYTPVFFYDATTAETDKLQSLGERSSSFSVVNVDDIIGGAVIDFRSSSGLFDSIFGWFGEILFPWKKVDEALQTLLERSKEFYESYCERHEQLRKNIEAEADSINKSKIQIKTYMVDQLYKVLYANGVRTSFSELQMESIDLRKFYINEKYILSKEMDRRLSDDILNLSQQIVPTLGLLFGWLKAKQFREKLRDLQMMQEVNVEHMNSDNSKLAIIEAAMGNVNKIYDDMLNRLFPIFENLLGHSDYGRDGDVYLSSFQKSDALRDIKDVIKVLAESKIHAKGTIDASSVINYSNELSVEYVKLKEGILSLAEIA